MTTVEPLQSTITVGLAPSPAFELFTAGLGSWWPAEFSWSQPDLLQSIDMDCRLGGMLFETGPHGFRIDWGRVTSWERPFSLSFLWQISADRVPVPDPNQASIVTVTFTHAGDSTRVDVTHEAWENHGVGGRAYRDNFTQAWPMALERYHQIAEHSGSVGADR